MTFDELLVLLDCSKSDFADAVDESLQTINNWEKRGIPKGKVLKVVRSFPGKVSPYQIDAEMYPDPDWLPPDLNTPKAQPANTGNAVVSAASHPEAGAPASVGH